jgi:hypothetical protein
MPRSRGDGKLGGNPWAHLSHYDKNLSEEPPPQIMWVARYKLLLGSVVPRLSAADSDR